MRDAIFLTVAIGIGATLVMDVWATIRRLLFAVQTPNYGLLGRWVGHMLRGHFSHHSIANSLSIPGEKIIGWTAHYITGITFAALLVAVTGRAWIDQPSLGPALIVGLATVLAPFLLMQPGIGAGIAGSRTANPAATRIQSLVTHLVFGFGLYISAVAVCQVTGS